VYSEVLRRGHIEVASLTRRRKKETMKEYKQRDGEKEERQRRDGEKEERQGMLECY
jgi:hypothetical protein